MCSTPKGSGSHNHVRRIDYSKPDDSDYTRMLRRASRRFEARQQARQEQEAEPGDRDPETTQGTTDVSLRGA